VRHARPSDARVGGSHTQSNSREPEEREALPLRPDMSDDGASLFALRMPTTAAPLGVSGRNQGTLAVFVRHRSDQIRNPRTRREHFERAARSRRRAGARGRRGSGRGRRGRGGRDRRRRGGGACRHGALGSRRWTTNGAPQAAAASKVRAELAELGFAPGDVTLVLIKASRSRAGGAQQGAHETFPHRWSPAHPSTTTSTGCASTCRRHSCPRRSAARRCSAAQRAPTRG
jgi:hypothetical protein